MEIIDFLVQGSSKDPYQVTFVEFNDNGDKHYSAFCTCKAGKMNKVCKHRMNIFAGKTENIVSDNFHQVKKLSEFYKGSVYEHINLKIKEYEKKAQKIKAKLDSERRELQHWMHKTKADSEQEMVYKFSIKDDLPEE